MPSQHQETESRGAEGPVPRIPSRRQNSVKPGRVTWRTWMQERALSHWRQSPVWTCTAHCEPLDKSCTSLSLHSLIETQDTGLGPSSSPKIFKTQEQAPNMIPSSHCPTLNCSYNLWLFEPSPEVCIFTKGESVKGQTGGIQIYRICSLISDNS